MKSRLHEKYTKEVIPALAKRFGHENTMAVPRLRKVTINIGMGEASANPKLLDTAAAELGQIAGQKPGQEIDCELQNSQGYGHRLHGYPARRTNV
jgi:large subunit ribosomal protein L5